MKAVYISKQENKETVYDNINGITVVDENRVAVDLYKNRKLFWKLMINMNL